MDSRPWTVIAITLILASFIAFAFLSRKPICIDSKLVEKIDRVGAGGTASMYRCNLRKFVPYDEKWFQEQTEISRRIQRVERFVESVSPFEEKIRVTVLENHPTTYRIVGHDLFIGEEIFDQPNTLEKGMLKIWYREKVNSMALDHALLEEAITDLMIFAAGADGLSVGTNEARWPFVVKGLPSYCTSRWVLPEHLQMCSSLRDHASSSLVVASARPLLSQAFIGAFALLSQGDRRQFLNVLPRYLGTLGLQEMGVGYTSANETWQNLVDISTEISGLIRGLEQQAKIHGGATEIWARSVRQKFEDQGFAEDFSQAKANLLIATLRLDGPKIFAQMKWGDLGGKAVLAEDETNLYLPPGKDALPKTIFGTLLAEKVVLLVCGPLSVSDLEPYFKTTTRLVAISTCDSEAGWNVVAFVGGDIQRLTKEYPEMKFIDFHLPSMALALKLKKLDSHQSLSLLADSSRELLRQKLGWRSADYDSRLKYYKVEGDLEAIRAYRP